MPPSENLLLSSLTSASRASLLSRLVEVDLPLRKSLYESDKTPKYAYFMTSGIASVVTGMEDGSTTEVGLVGREGVVGAMQLLGPAAVPTDCFIQLVGSGLRMPYAELLSAFRANEEIRDRVLEFVQ